MSGKTFRAAVFFPLMIIGYMETLRLATFEAFGWIYQDLLFSIICFLVVGHLVLRYVWPTLKRWQLATGLLAISFPGLVWAIWGLEPALGAAGYGMVLFLAAGFMFAQKNSSAMLLAGLFLLAVDILVTGEQISKTVFFNLVFAGVIKSQAFLLGLEDDPRVRLASGLGKVNFWMVAGLLPVFVAAYAAAEFIPERPGRDLASLALKYRNSSINESLPADDQANAYALYWKKFQDFRFSGQVPFDNRPVMFVKSPFPAYWRGEAADLYTGSGWISTFEAPRKVDARALGPSFAREGGLQAWQEFRMAPGMKSEVLFRAGIPLEIEIVGGIIQTDEGDNFFVEDTDLGDIYKVHSVFPQPGQIEAGDLAIEGSPEKFRKYLQLPENLPERVRTLAADVAGGSETALGKAEAFEKYLTENFPYKLSVSPLPQGRDVTDYFLFELQEGYCTYHSTAMVVMLRSVGIPARWIKGFTSGTFNRGTGEYEVLVNDAHAWVEAYIPGVGWQSFDPTPPLMDSLKVPAAAGDSQVAADDKKLEELESQRGFGWLALLGGLAAVAGTVLTYFHRKTRINDQAVPGHEIDCIYGSLLKLMAQKGSAKLASQTPFEFAALLAARLPKLQEEVAILTNAYLKYKYAGQGLNDEEMKEVRAAWRKIKLTSPSRL